MAASSTPKATSYYQHDRRRAASSFLTRRACATACAPCAAAAARRLLCWTASAHDPAPAVAAPPPTRAAPPTTVKVIVWDLDGTLWRGALEDDDRVEPRRALVDAIGALADRGIVSTVCSRAPRAAAEGMLDALGIRELLVFNEYDVAGSKGARVLRTLEAMHLSPRHALFVDDEASNRADVLSRCEGIGALSPEDFEALLPVGWGAPGQSRTPGALQSPGAQARSATARGGGRRVSEALRHRRDRQPRRGTRR